MNLALVSRALTETYGPGWASGGTLTGLYLKPVVAGDTVRVQLRVTERGDASVDHAVEVLNQDDELVLVGQARRRSVRHSGRGGGAGCAAARRLAVRLPGAARWL